MKRSVSGAGAILAAIVLLSGCTAKAPLDESAPSPTSTPTVSSEALPAVSLNTTCNLLFGSDVDGPVAQAADIVTRFIANSDLSTITEDELAGTIDSLDSAAKNADASLKPYIDAQTDVLQQLLDAMTTNTNSSVDLVDYKASSLELLNQCESFLY